MICREQLPDDGRADESGGTCDKYAHGQNLLNVVGDDSVREYHPGKVVTLSY